MNNTYFKKNHGNHFKSFLMLNMSLSTDTPVQAVTPIKQSPVLIGQFFLVLSFTCSSGGFNGKFIVIPWDGAC
jgi:hypothetical protein